jgi:hypothetical protein
LKLALITITSKDQTNHDRHKLGFLLIRVTWQSN